MDQHPVFELLLQELASDGARAEALETLRADCGHVPPGITVKLFFGYLMAETAATARPALRPRAEAILRQMGSRFGNVALPTAVAFTAWLGRHVHPALDLVESANRLLADTMARFRDTPFMQTFVRATGGSWAALMNDFPTWRPLFGQFVDFDVHHLGPRCVELVSEGPEVMALRYFAAGSIEGLLAVFGQAGTVTYRVEHFVATTRVSW